MRGLFIRYLPILVVMILAGCNNSNQEKLNANKDLMEQLGAINDLADWDKLDMLLHEDFKRHSVATTANPIISSIDEFKSHERAIRELYPDRQVTYDKVVAEGDFVAARATFTGTNKELEKSIQVKYLVMMRMQDGKIAEIWVEWDNLAVLKQLGLWPPPKNSI